MIKIFRKIRYNLMETGKTVKYFKYAIGEIILVMIGILLALQVNNWNQNRINKNEEQEIIAKLHKDFKTNKENLATFIIENNNEISAHLVLMNLIGSSREALLKHNLDSLLYQSFSASEVAFADNTIKSIMQSGRLDLLKNEKVTDLLYKWNTLSEIRKTRMYKLDDWSNNHFIPYLLTKISFKEMDATSSGLKWAGQSKVKPDYYPLFQEVEFENYLDNSLWFHNQVFLRCEETERLIDEIIHATKP